MKKMLPIILALIIMFSGCAQTEKAPEPEFDPSMLEPYTEGELREMAMGLAAKLINEHFPVTSSWIDHNTGRPCIGIEPEYFDGAVEYVKNMPDYNEVGILFGFRAEGRPIAGIGRPEGFDPAEAIITMNEDFQKNGVDALATPGYSDIVGDEDIVIYVFDQAALQYVRVNHYCDTRKAADNEREQYDASMHTAAPGYKASEEIAALVDKLNVEFSSRGLGEPAEAYMLDGEERIKLTVSEGRAFAFAWDFREKHPEVSVIERY